MVRPPQPCIHMFLIDVSREAVQNGVVDLVCRSILANLEKISGDKRTKIGFITCVTSSPLIYSGHTAR